MIECMYLGSSPANEPCVQTTDSDYSVKALDECKRWIDLLRATYSVAHDGQECPLRLSIKRNSHDFGEYFEVVCKFDANDESQECAAYWLEANAPLNWK